VVEVFADVGCPFTHVGLQRFVAHRAAVERDDVVLWVRAWPLEIVNGHPLDPAFIDEEIDDIRAQVSPTLFAGFSRDAFPATSLPAMAMAHAAYRIGLDVGEQVSLELRDLLFEQGVDIARPDVLDAVARRHGIEVGDADAGSLAADHAEGVERGVIGSPHFFTPTGGFFCPSLQVSRDEHGELRVLVDPEGFDQFIESCLG